MTIEVPDAAADAVRNARGHLDDAIEYNASGELTYTPFAQASAAIAQTHALIAIAETLDTLNCTLTHVASWAVNHP